MMAGPQWILMNIDKTTTYARIILIGGYENQPIFTQTVAPAWPRRGPGFILGMASSAGQGWEEDDGER